jgi:hypothetical protein
MVGAELARVGGYEPRTHRTNPDDWELAALEVLRPWKDEQARMGSDVVLTRNDEVDGVGAHHAATHSASHTNLGPGVANYLNMNSAQGDGAAFFDEVHHLKRIQCQRRAKTDPLFAG